MILSGQMVIDGIQSFKSLELNTETGRIQSLSEPVDNPDVVYNEDCLIFPGFIDIHIHAREDVSGKHTYKEDFKSAGQAAINGGVTHVADMPNNPVAPVTNEKYRAKQMLTSSSDIPITLYAGIGPDTKPLTLNVPYKAFMGPSVGDLFFKSNQQLEDVIKSYTGKAVSFHCEDPVILEDNHSQPTHELRRPASAEILATEFALQLIDKYGLKGKLCHYSTGKGLDMIIEARKKGVEVTCEVTPTHLFFHEGMLTDANHKWLQMNPPVRTESDRQRLLNALKNGDIDYLATDHAPHTIEEKLKGTSGVPHLDTYGAFVTWLILNEKVPLSIIEKVCAVNPGDFVNQFSDTGSEIRQGRLQPGYAASLTVLNLNQPMTITREHVRSKCGWSPFEGFTFPGSVEATWVHGKQVRPS